MIFSHSSSDLTGFQVSKQFCTLLKFSFVRFIKCSHTSPPFTLLRCAQNIIEKILEKNIPNDFNIQI